MVTWKEFEDLAEKIQKEFSPNAKITRNEKIMGQRSKTLREVDIVIRETVGSYPILIAIDCKNYKKRVNLCAFQRRGPASPTDEDHSFQ